MTEPIPQKGLIESIEAWLDDDQNAEWPEQDSAAVSEEACREAAEILVVHGLLAEVLAQDDTQDRRRVESVMRAISATENVESPAKNHGRPRLRRPLVLATSIAAIAVGIVLVLTLSGPGAANAAMASLERVIAVSELPLDRTYSIRIVEEHSSRPLARIKRHDRHRFDKWRRRRRPQETLEGAILHVRGKDQFVFVRSLLNGSTRISGNDGTQSWSFKGNGPVRVSSDPTRFRGGMPGTEQDLPFINIRTQLEQFRSEYEIELIEEPQADPERERLRGLLCVRRSQQIRGPVAVEIWFESESGTIETMFLDGLPQGKGGAKSVLLELIEQRDLGPDFFSHTAHHEPVREIRFED